MNETDIQRLTDRMDIIDLVNRFSLSVDRQEFARARACLADRVDFDSIALGGTAITQPAEDLVEAICTNLSILQATQHLITNHHIALDGDTARCMTEYQAYHFLPEVEGGNLWIHGGKHIYSLVRTPNGWKISGLVFEVAWRDGNPRLFEHARQAQIGSKD